MHGCKRPGIGLLVNLGICGILCLRSAAAGEPSTGSRPDSDDSSGRVELRDAEGTVRVRSVAEQIPAADATTAATPIDLSSALRLAGVQNLQIVVAQQRVEAAVGFQQLAAAQLLPNLNIGTSYDNHTGVLQQDNGNILSVNRGALYAGAGAFTVAAATVQIPGLQYNINISQGIYDYLISRQVTNERRFDRRAVDNAILRDVGVAYTELLRTTGARGLAILARNDAAEIARLTATYAKTGAGRQADADRAATELARRQHDVAEAEARLAQASHRLCELLNLDTTLHLVPLESQVVPEPVVPTRVPLPELLATALLERPELQARRTAIRAAFLELDSAKVLPFSPTMIGGFSGGAFGGGSSVGAAAGQARFDNFSDRTDSDVVFFWSLQNLGVGNKALIDVARAKLRRSQLEELVVLDQVRDEVASAYVLTQSRFAEIGRQAQAVRTGVSALREDMRRVRGRQGLPIELLDSLRQVAGARIDYLDAIIGFNQAEIQLYVALGSPPADTLARPVPKELSEPPASTFKTE